MIQAIRSIWGQNVRTPEFKVVIDETELTPVGVRALVKMLRLRNQELENILQARQMQILSLLRENSRLKKEASLWLEDWIKINVKSDAQRVDVKSA